MINHDGMESLTAADDNILGWVCRAHGALLAQNNINNNLSRKRGA